MYLQLIYLYIILKEKNIKALIIYHILIYIYISQPLCVFKVSLFFFFSLSRSFLFLIEFVANMLI